MEFKRVIFRFMETSGQVEEEKPFQPVRVQEHPKGIVESIKSAATNLVKKVQRLIKPVKKLHKEVIINAETLETRVAVLEEGKLEEFNIERTTEERLVGSMFKGKVRNLEDGLKAAFVDIGFEKNAFLHYRSEEHTSELQSQSNLVCRLLLEKKKNNT